MKPSGRIAAIHVGKPRRYERDQADPESRPWYSAIYKDRVDGRIWLGTLNLEGDRQADLRVHGGPNRAALCYAAGHYVAWKEELPDNDWQPGMFGENFTLDGLDESNVCMGDTFTVGAAVIQVSQLRGPCFKLARRVDQPDMVERVLATGRCGWYVRVLEEGWVETGQLVELQSRIADAKTLLDIHRAKFGSRDDSLDK